MPLTAQDVYTHVLQFFVDHCGGEGEFIDPRDESTGPCLLRTACMGNPERTMQGELFAYLKRQESLRPVLEYRLHRLDGEDGGKGRGNSIDIMVFDSQYCPIAAIELKHHSRQQGNLTRLISTLDADRTRLSKLGVPSIQVGLYTELLQIGSEASSREQYQDFRFITAYAYTVDKIGNHRQKFRSEAKPIDPTELREWAENNFAPLTVSFRGRTDRFVTRSGSTVAGRVHYIIGVGQSGPRLPESFFKSTAI